MTSLALKSQAVCTGSTCLQSQGLGTLFVQTKSCTQLEGLVDPHSNQPCLAANKKTRTAKHNIPYQIYFTSQNPYFFNRNQSLTARFTTK